MRNFRVVAAFVVVMFVISACSSGGSTASSSAGPNASLAVLKPIRLQLQWFPQAQFAGYFAALDKGYYRDEGFDVTILPGAVEIVPATVVAGGQAEFGISWVPRMLAPRESGADGVVIAQVFQRSPTLQVSFKDKNITKPEDLKGEEGRLVGLRQRVRAVRRAAQGRDRSVEQERRDDRHPAVRHGRLRRR